MILIQTQRKARKDLIDWEIFIGNLWIMRHANFWEYEIGDSPFKDSLHLLTWSTAKG